MYSRNKRNIVISLFLLASFQWVDEESDFSFLFHLLSSFILFRLIFILNEPYTPVAVDFPRFNDVHPNENEMLPLNANSYRRTYSIRNLYREYPYRSFLLPSHEQIIEASLLRYYILHVHWSVAKEQVQTCTPAITFENSTLLEKVGIQEEWLPEEFICPLTLHLIDGLPVKAPVTPQRFNYKALLDWLTVSQTNPINRDALFPYMLYHDYRLECKIRVFVELLQLNSTYLKTLSPQEAQSKVTVALEKIDGIFPTQIKNKQKLYALADKIIQVMRSNTIDRETSKSLIVAQKEQNMLSSVVPFKLYVEPNVFHFFKSDQSRALIHYNEENKNKYIIAFFNQYGSCYELLKIPETATHREIIKAYNLLALRYHPDKNPNSDDAEQFIQLTMAKNILLNRELRDLHDEFFSIKPRIENQTLNMI